MIQDLITKNEKLARFEFLDVCNYFKTYTDVLLGQEDDIPLNLNANVPKRAIN